MKRIGFKMTLKPGFKNEYKRRHDALWPELRALLKANGISDYVIYLDEATDTLFACRKVDEGAAGDLASHPVMRKWWAHMADIMETHDDLSPVVTMLEEVFYME